MRRSLDLAIAEALGRLEPGRTDVTILDVGGRSRPYAALAARVLGRKGARVRHLVVDPGTDADVRGVAESLPVREASADLVLCTQVLEHVPRPDLAISEMARALRPGGACLLSTHGTWFYHPDPEDYWRWTPAGLERVFRAAGFAEVSVSPVGGTKLALASLALTTLDRAAGPGVAGALARGLVVAPLNATLWSLLRRRVTGRRGRPGDLVVDYLVLAMRA